MAGVLDQLLAQEVIYEQYRGAGTQEQVAQITEATEGALTEITSNTLTIGPRSAGSQNLELPQGLAPANDPTFDNLTVTTVTATDAPTTRTNLGLGNLATKNAAAASADSAPAQSAAYVQADVQAILTELRDLKAKLRTAGILTP